MRASPPLPDQLLSTPKPSTNRRCALSVASHVENLVYWSFTEINRYYEIKLEGLISKEYYNKIKSDLYKDKNYSFGEVIDNLGDVRFKISDLVFNHDPEFIITYQCLGRFYDRNLNEYIENDDDE